MMKRSDVDYYLKSSWFASTSPTPAPGCAAACSSVYSSGVRSLLQSGNDTIAFYSVVPGYYPSSGSQSPISLIAYRVNAQNKLERVAKGLVWNGVSASSTPVVFLPSTINGSWASATDLTASPTPDPDTDSIGPYVFRFEYYYLLKNVNL